jgi:hypothetical protein
MGCVAANAQDLDSKKFFASFFQKRSASLLNLAQRRRGRVA